MRITAIDVQDQKFRVAFRGFDPVEVDAFLQRVSDELERLVEERDGLRSELEGEKKARRILEEALASARTVQEGLLERARGEAEVTVSQARLRADRILAEANEELLRIRREVQTIRERRDLALGELAALSRTLCEWAERKKTEEAAELPPLISEDPGEDTPEESEELGVRS
jgi:cell division initiation protein